MTIETHATELDSLFHQVMEAMTEGVAITNIQSQLVYANRALEQLLGYGPGELVGEPSNHLFADGLQEQAQVWKAHMEGEATVRYEALLLHTDGSTIPVLASSSPLGKDGRRSDTLWTFTDLREAQSLREQVEKLTKPALMGQQLASIIHELSNSLTILSLQAQLLAKKGPLAPQVEENLAVIRDQARRMIEMVDTLRASSDPNSKTRGVRTDANALVERTLALHNHQLEREEILIKLDLDKNLPPVNADPYKIQQVLINLINNARIALAERRPLGKLTLSTRTISRAGEGPPRVQIRVADNGPGIPPQVMPHIFEPFYTTRPGRGMGLGLSICKQITEEYGGLIWGESRVGRGATLVLELPAVTPEDAPTTFPGMPHASPRTATRHRVLVVDDDLRAARSMGRVLLREGFQVTTASEARQALVLMDSGRFDLIVSDLDLARMEGPLFWEAVRERSPRLAQRLIFAGDEREGKRFRMFLRASGCAWIEKPFKPQELLSAVREALPNGGSPDTA
jgi:two-component system NtrC family sensor kinase